MDPYIRPGDIVDSAHPDVVACARAFADGSADVLTIAKRCFEFVRDAIKHSGDFDLRPVTCKASEVLKEGSGYCYAKSHLLAALLRARGIPAGLCYQRLSLDDAGPPFSLHGLNAVWLPGVGWYRVDPRGNRTGIHTEFLPPVERLAFSPRIHGEADLPEIFAEPLPVVVEALKRHADARSLRDDLPDVILWGVDTRDSRVR